MFVRFIALLFILSNSQSGFAQADWLVLDDVDSAFIKKPVLSNDLRLFYGGQGNNISLGSSRESESTLSGNIYTNTNDYLGIGITYKWLDGDLSYSLPGTTYLNEERSNLKQVKLSLSYSTRKIAFRIYYSDNKGVVVSDVDDQFQSTPSLHEVRSGVQMTYLFNSSRYSYRASMYQSEYQLKTAGSFLLRLEPFYRNLGGQGSSMIPVVYDVTTRFGDQVGLEYVRAPGILLLPGYGINVVIPNSRFFISPMIFAGLGAAFNTYQSQSGKKSYTNPEYAASFNLNMGYNGSRYYSKILFSWSAGYAPLNPSYFTSNNISVSLWVGIRFRDVEKFIPASIF